MIKECLISGYIILQEDLETTYLICISERLYIALGADWRVITGKYRGKKYVRLGTIVKPKNISEDDLKQLIGDAEATLIYCLGDQLLQNKMCTISCNPSQLLMITYIGRRGNIPEQVFISDEDWIV